MKKALHPFCALATLLLFTLSGTAQIASSTFQHIPPDADNVYHMNLGTLGSKISWDDIVNMIPTGKISSDQEVLKYVKDPTLSGIDFHQGIIVAQGHLAKNADSPTYVTILLHLSDSGKLLSLIRSKSKGLHTFHLTPKSTVSGKDKMAFAWDDKLVVFTVIIPTPKAQPATTDKNKTGPSKPTSSAYYTLIAAKKSVAALEGFTNSFYTTNTVFTSGFSDDADIHMWSPQGSWLKQLGDLAKKKNPFGNDFKMPASKSQLHTLTTLRFDAGKIVVHASTAIPPDSASLYTMYTSHPLNTDLITHIPGKAILGMVNMHIDPAGFKSILQHYHSQHMVDSLLAKSGLSIDDILKSFKGDFLIAATQPAQLPDTGKVEPGFFFVVTIGDMPAFMKVIGKLGINSDSTGGMMGKMKAGYTLRDNILVLGRKGQTDAFFSTNNPANLSLVNDHVKSSAMSVVLDIKAISAFMQASDPNGSPKTQQLLHFLGVLDRLTFTPVIYHDGVVESFLELKTTNDSENSLRSIFNLLH